MFLSSSQRRVKLLAATSVMGDVLSDFQGTFSYIMLSFPAFISEFATHPKTWGLAYNEKRNEISRDNHVIM